MKKDVRGSYRELQGVKGRKGQIKGGNKREKGGGRGRKGEKNEIRCEGGGWRRECSV